MYLNVTQKVIIALFLCNRIQQREFDKDSRPDLIVNCAHPGYVDTDMTSHKGPLTIEQGTLTRNEKTDVSSFYFHLILCVALF